MHDSDIGPSLKVGKEVIGRPNPNSPPCPLPSLPFSIAGYRVSGWSGQPNHPTSPFSSHLPSFPSPSSFVPLKVGPLHRLYTYRDLRERCKLPQQSQGPAEIKSDVFSLKIWHLVESILLISSESIGHSVCRPGCIGSRSAWTPSMTVHPLFKYCMGLRRDVKHGNSYASVDWVQLQMYCGSFISGLLNWRSKKNVVTNNPNICRHTDEFWASTKHKKTIFRFHT